MGTHNEHGRLLGAITARIRLATATDAGQADARQSGHVTKQGQADGSCSQTAATGAPINGITQTMPAGMLASNLQAQGMAQQVSNPATIGGNTDYVGQLKALLGERQQSGSASVPLTNPYEQRLQS